MRSSIENSFVTMREKGGKERREKREGRKEEIWVREENEEQLEESHVRLRG
jgi:hypothetical protein